jgi:hypothetical protein
MFKSNSLPRNYNDETNVLQHPNEHIIRGSFAYLGIGQII